MFCKKFSLYQREIGKKLVTFRKNIKATKHINTLKYRQCYSLLLLLTDLSVIFR